MHMGDTHSCEGGGNVTLGIGVLHHRLNCGSIRLCRDRRSRGGNCKNSLLCFPGPLPGRAARWRRPAHIVHTGDRGYPFLRCEKTNKTQNVTDCFEIRTANSCQPTSLARSTRSPLPLNHPTTRGRMVLAILPRPSLG